MKNRIPRYCIACGRDTGPPHDGWRDDEEKDSLSHGPSNGVFFITHGNYGSVVLDMGAEVEGYICDECLVKRGDRLYVVAERDYEAETKQRDECLARLRAGESVPDVFPAIHYQDLEHLKLFSDYTREHTGLPEPLIRPDMDDPAFADVVELQRQLHDEWDRNIDLHQRCAELLRMNLLLMNGKTPAEARAILADVEDGSHIRHAHVDVPENEPYYEEIFKLEERIHELLDKMIEPNRGEN